MMFRGFDELFRKKLQKVAHFVEKHQNSSIWLKLAAFRANYQVLRFSRSFRRKVAKCASYRQKACKIIDLAKTFNFSRKLSRFEVFINFSEKSCKRWIISRKIRKKRRFRQNTQLFKETITFRRFDQLFGKKLQKLAHFVKKHEKSSISPRLATFGANYHVSRF